MRIHFLSIFLLIACTSLLSCHQPGAEKNQPTGNDGERQAPVDPVDDYHGQPIAVLDPRVSGTDSAVFVFYTDPYMKDSLRYTRYYSSYGSRDQKHLSILLKALQDDTERMPKTKPCRSEGKIWCFREGEVIQTIYFSTRQPGCHHIYFIKNGLFYYSSMPADLETLLGSLKKEAVEEPNRGIE